MTRLKKWNWFEIKYKIALLNGYFDKGMSITKYIKNLLFISGLASDGQKFWIIVLLGGIYLASCFFIGWLAYKYEYVEAEMEVGNRHNRLAKELREKFK